MKRLTKIYYNFNYPGVERKRVCCNCGNNIRTGESANVKCHCAIDGHYIGYIECFEGWCRRWKRDRKWDNVKENFEEVE